MHNLWIEQNIFAITEQRLIDQKSHIIKKKWFSDIELEAIRRSTDDAVYRPIGNVIECDGARRSMDVNEEVQQVDAIANSNMIDSQRDECDGQLTSEDVNQIQLDVESEESKLN